MENFRFDLPNNAPISKSSALIQLSSPNLVINRNDLLYKKFKINELLDNDLNQAAFAHNFDDLSIPILIVFESALESNDSKIFWRTNDNKKFNSIALVEDPNATLAQYVNNFIHKEIQNKRSGILSQFQSKLNHKIHDLGNHKQQNLLMLAVKENCLHIVLELIKRNFDVDYKDMDNLNAVDYAWQNYSNLGSDEGKERSNQIILHLLKANSKFPDKNIGFEVEKASVEVTKFIELCENVHFYVSYDDDESLVVVLKDVSDLDHLYDRHNVSILSTASNFPNLKIFNILMNHGKTPGKHESYDFIYDKFEEKNLKIIKKQRLENMVDFPKAHLFILKSKSKIDNDQQNHANHLKIVEEAFEIIDKDDCCSKVLKLASVCKHLNILFDFQHDTTYYLDEHSERNVKGRAYEDGTVFIGAKELCGANKSAVLGVIIHELCHFVLLMVYMNDFKPYPKGISDEKEEFENNVVPECITNQNKEIIIKNLIDQDLQDLLHSELIVVVVEMKMVYFDTLHDDEGKLRQNAIYFDKLFEYFKDIVEQDIEKGMIALKLLQDEQKEITYNDLTNPMKAAILHLPVNFQGEETSLLNMIGSDSNILNTLTSASIRNMLLKNKLLYIGDICSEQPKFEIVERKIIHYDDFDDVYYVDFYLSLNEIIKKETTNEEINEKSSEEFSDESSEEFNKENNVMLLSGSPGEGKTTTLVCKTRSLKNLNNETWVSFIKLREHQNELEIFKGKENNIKIEEVFVSLCKILKIEEAIDLKIFTELFQLNKVILLFDGIDEICPDFDKIIIEILKKLRNETKIQIWISTRPQQVSILSKELYTKSYKLAPYTEDERKELISNFLKFFNIVDQKDQLEKIENIEQIINSIESESYRNSYLNNSLMIQIITKIYVNENLELDSSNINIYDIFEKVVSIHKVHLDSKIKFDDRDPFADVSLKQIHYVLALNYVLNVSINGDPKSDDLTIVKNFKLIRNKLIPDKIQRYGFLTFSFNETKDNIILVDFTHKTYAEFFVVEFLMSCAFKSSPYFSERDFVKVLNLLMKIPAAILYYEKLHDFLLTFLKTDSRVGELNKMLQIIIQKKINGEDLLKRKYRIFECIALMIRKSDRQLSKKIWQLDENESVLEKCADSCANKIGNTLELLEKCFGENWDEHFTLNKANSEKIEKYNFESNLSSTSRNIFKFVQMAYHCFNLDSKTKFLEGILNLLADHDLKNEEIETKVYLILFDILKNKNLKIIENMIEISLSRLTINVSFFEAICGKMSPQYVNATAKSLNSICRKSLKAKSSREELRDTYRNCLVLLKTLSLDLMIFRKKKRLKQSLKFFYRYCLRKINSNQRLSNSSETSKSSSDYEEDDLGIYNEEQIDVELPELNEMDIHDE